MPLLPFLLLAAEVAGAKPVAGPIEHEHRMVVEAVRGCPEPVAGEVVICSRDRGIAEGFRLPKLDPRFADTLRANGRGGLTDPAFGASGAGACSPAGAAGFTGCSQKDYDAWAANKRRQQAAAHAYEDGN